MLWLEHNKYIYLAVILVLVLCKNTQCQDIVFHETGDMVDKEYYGNGDPKLRPMDALTMPMTIPMKTATPNATATTPNCENLCVTLDFCPHLFKLLENPSSVNLKTLKDASCGFTPDGEPLVVCKDFLCDTTRTASGKTTTAIPEKQPISINFTQELTEAPPGSTLENNLLRIRNISPLQNEDCGIALPSRINGGLSASFGEFPWIAGIALHSSIGPQIVCGGALIADEWVITAAHCVVDSGHRARNISHVRIGALNISDMHEEGAENIPVSQVIFHEKFRERPVVKNDIAVLKLSRKVTPGASVGSICLPNSTSEQTYYDPKISTTIAGWGSDGSKTGYNILQKVDIPLVPSEQCKSAFFRVRIRVLPDLQVCAGTTGKDSCKGDSGGPLMTMVNGRTVLIGVISYGTVQCDGRLPGVYTKVTAYMDWIRDVVNKNS